ncbi:MAG: hypothetical protein RR280_04285 [Bacteroidaceae bacterium]
MTTDSVLDAEKHKMLIADLPNICQQSGVPAAYIHQSMRSFCTPLECDWVINYHQMSKTGKCGLVLLGDSIETRCLAISGALIRNYIDARVVTLQNVIDYDIHPTVLVIPNFFVAAIDCKPHPTWKVDQVYGILLERMSTGHPTILGISDLKGLEMVYGSSLYKHVRENYMFSKVG